MFVVPWVRRSNRRQIYIGVWNSDRSVASYEPRNKVRVAQCGEFAVPLDPSPLFRRLGPLEDLDLFG